jgi:hypothetical protein
MWLWRGGVVNPYFSSGLLAVHEAQAFVEEGAADASVSI